MLVLVAFGELRDDAATVSMLSHVLLEHVIIENRGPLKLR